MEYSLKFRIYPNVAQSLLIQKIFGSCRFVYNHYLALRKTTYDTTGQVLSYVDCAKDLTVLKKQFSWLREADSTALQSSLKDLDIAFQNFFRGCKSGMHIGYPKFKSKKYSRKSYKTKSNVQISEHAIRLPKLGWVRAKIFKSVQGRILNATVSQAPTGKYFVSVCWTDVDMFELPKTGDNTGVDLGLKSFAVLSDGTKIENPKHMKQAMKRLKRAQRRLSRKSKGSQNYEKQRRRLAVLHEKVLNQRQDFLQKTSTDIIRRYDLIALEDLTVRNLMRNHKLAGGIQDVSWSAFRRMLEYKSVWYGKQVIIIPRFFPSSQICSQCGFQWSGTKDLFVRDWTCPICNTIHDRDVNAARNILAKGLGLAVS